MQALIEMNSKDRRLRTCCVEHWGAQRLRRARSLFPLLILSIALCCMVAVVSPSSYALANEANGNQQNDGAETNAQVLIARLPDISEVPEAQRYYYDQISDVEKVLYWKAEAATFDNPSFTLSGLSSVQIEALSAHQRWLTALLSDKPRVHFKWQRLCGQSIDGDTMVFTLYKMPIATDDYFTDKSEARVRQIGSNVGIETDLYVRYRKLATLLARDMTYNDDYPYGRDGRAWEGLSLSGGKVFTDSQEEVAT